MMNKENQKPPDPNGRHFSTAWTVVGGGSGKHKEREKIKGDYGENEARDKVTNEPEEGKWRRT